MKEKRNSDNMGYFPKNMLEKAVNKTDCHEPTYVGTDGNYILKSHQHDDGTIVINSFEIKVVKPVEEQIEELIKKHNVDFVMMHRGHDQRLDQL